MLKRILFAVVCLLIPTAMRAQQCTVGGTGAGGVTVSGNLQDLGGINITAGTTFARFTLTGYGANIPRVSGTTAIAAPCYDLKPNGSGVIGGTIWGNDVITLGSSSAHPTFYIVCIFQSGQPFRCNNFTITGSTFNLNSAPPNTTNPVGTPPVTLIPGSATLTYTSISAQTCQEQTLTVNGATAGKGAFFSPAATLGNTNLSWSAWVSASATISVRVCNPTTGAITPNAVTWNGWVQQ